MNSASDEQFNGMDRFDEWLAGSPIQPRPGLLARTRCRMESEDQALEQVLDGLFKPNPALADPHMVNRVRNRLDPSAKPAADKVIWFNWLTPAAAACILGIAFFSFQSKAPSPTASLASHDAPALSIPVDLSQDPELTRIFALASNLQTSSDMSRLQSVDQLAFLFE